MSSEKIDSLFFLRVGLERTQAHYNRQNVSISDAVNLFHAQTTQTDALPILVFIKCLFDKHGKNFEAALKDTCTSVMEDPSRIDGLTEKWLDMLVAKFNAFPE